MRPPRWKALVDKSIAACCAAIEIYNKPVVPHREETFAILVVAAWELLLKARLIQENGNQLKAIYETEAAKRKDGKPSKRKSVRRNKAGNPITIGISTAIDRAKALPAKPLDAACKENLELLVEVRNNAVHFVNEDRDLAIRVHEVGVAALRNYATALADWFEHDISNLRFAILPLSFDSAVAAQVVPAAKRSQQAQNLLAHMERAIADAPASSDGRFAVSLRVETKIVGAGTTDAVAIKLGKGPGAVLVELTDAEFLKRWPHDHKQLVALVKKRLPGVIINNAFHAHVRTLRAEERFAKDRRLDLSNPKSTLKKTYYSQAMVDALVARLSGSGGGGHA
jgi:hypothetical protein